MPDAYVLRAQQFVNSYSVTGIPRLTEDGVTSAALTAALVRVLQHELGIGTLSNSVNPATLKALTATLPVIDAATATAAGPVGSAIVRVIQSALYCQGRDGGEIDGVFDERVAAAVRQLKQDMSVSTAFPGDGVTPKMVRSLLSADTHTLAPGGNPQVRAVQQWLNGRYVNRTNVFVVGCDGRFSRTLHKTFLVALQYELGLDDAAATGAFGATTQAALRKRTLTVGSTGPWVQLFSAATVLARRPGAELTSAFDAALSARVQAFQSFVRLTPTGTGNYPTWAALLVSTGDVTRQGTACDCSTTVTDARAKALHAAGYRIVGRYLSNVPGSRFNKMIQPGELATLVRNGLRAFPIYQTYGGSASYFTARAGASDALAAIDRARFHGFRAGTRIYFAVDFDALEAEVTTNVIPYFRAIRDTFRENRSPYLIGVYGPRDLCTRLGGAGLTTGSFLADLSTGYTGNLGHPHPADWMFDQFATVTVGKGAAAIQIDKQIASGRDPGQRAFTPVKPARSVDVLLPAARRVAVRADLQKYLTSRGVPESGRNRRPSPQPNTTSDAFDLVVVHDDLITGLARTLRLRKALIAGPLLTQYRLRDAALAAREASVVAHHRDGVPDPTKTARDCPTGPAQILAATAIKARNHCIRSRVIAGKILDPARDADLWAVWQQLQDPVFSIATIAYVHLWVASTLALPRPGLTYSDANTRRVLSRFPGVPAVTAADGVTRFGVHLVLEKHFAPLRSA